MQVTQTGTCVYQGRVDGNATTTLMAGALEMVLFQGQ